MATTSRKKKSVKKEVIEEVVEVPTIVEATPAVVDEVKKEFLSADEHRIVETQPLLIENAKLLMACEEQNLKVLTLEFELLDMKIKKQKVVVAERHRAWEAAKARYDIIIGGISKNHGLATEKFSYKNDTGEIIL